ncbi:MAG: hypothetical protein U0N20_03495 [Clostridium sp.]
MKAKKWLTIITFVVSILSLVLAFIIGKSANCIFYDIAMALFGSAVLGFIMSATEYFVERRKAMEEFWIQAINILNELRKIKYLDIDTPEELVLDCLKEEQINKLKERFSENNDIQHIAKDSLISLLEENITISSPTNADLDSILEEYIQNIDKCMDSYRQVSTIEKGLLDNAYGNLEFIFGNRKIRQNAYDKIYDKIRKILYDIKSEAFHFNLLKEGKGNYVICALKIYELNSKYFKVTNKNIHGYKNTLVYQHVFDEIEESLEKFRCKIYRTKYEKVKPEPVLGKMIHFNETNNSK